MPPFSLTSLSCPSSSPVSQGELAGAEALCKEMQTVGEDRRLLENDQSMLRLPSIPIVNWENPAPSTKLAAHPGSMLSPPAKVAGIIFMVQWVVIEPPFSFFPES